MSRIARLIFNPKAGQGNPDQSLAVIQQQLSTDFELDIQIIHQDICVEQLVQEAVSLRLDGVIVAGGDGTISTVAGGLLHTSIPLGIIPCGTANALATALGISSNLEEACQVILNGTTQVIDTARCNGRTMVLLAGIGFEAETIEETEAEMKKRWGLLAYVLSGIQQLQELKQFEATLETETEKFSVSQVAALTVANVAPPTSILAQGPAYILPHDGMLDVTIVAPINRTDAVALSYHLLQTALQNEATQRDDISYFHTRKIRITTNPPQKVVIDGELFGETPLQVECVPQSLTLYVP